MRSNLFDDWGSLSSPETLEIAVDGTPAATYTFTDQDFIDADTGFISLDNNTATAWVAVFNARIPGLTATEDAGAVLLTSNLDRTSRAQIEIVGGTLVSKQVFEVETAVGSDRDYTLDRNRAHVKLVAALSDGDRLAAGSVSTRGFVESSDIVPVDLTANGKVFVAVDGDAEIVETGITASSTFNITKPSTGTWGARYRITATSGSPFTNAQAGDWLIIWDPDAAWDELRNIWRLVETSTNYIELEHEDLGGIVDTGVSFTEVGVAIVRYDGQLQVAVVPTADNYTADTFVDELSTDLVGVTPSVYRTDRVRLRTNSFGSGGDVAVVAVDAQGERLLLPVSNAVENRDSHLGSVESGNQECGTPTFEFLEIDASAAADEVDINLQPISPDQCLHGLKNTLVVASNDRYGNNKDLRTFLETVVDGSPSTLTLRTPAPVGWLPQDRVYLGSPFAIGPEDDLTVLADQNISTGRFGIQMWRALRPQSSTYGITNAFKDIGDGTGSEEFLAAAFGLDFDFNDFAVFMRARAKSHSADSTRATLWRHKRFGLEGERIRLAHTYPAAPDQATAVEVDLYDDDEPGVTHVSVVLPSDVQKTGYPLRNSTGVGYGYFQGANPLPIITVCLGFDVASATRAGTTVTLTLTLPSGAYAITDHSIPNGSTIWLESTDAGNFPTGAKTVTGVTATTLTYTEAGPAVTTPNTGTVSKDVAGEATFDGASPSNIAVGDLIRLEDYINIPVQWRGMTVQITDLGSQFLQGFAERTSGGETTTLTWQTISDSDQILFYDLDSIDAEGIQDAVNTLGDASPVTATILGAGTGTIAISSRDELLVEQAGYTLEDGLNWVRSTDNPPNATTDYEMTFKAGVDAGLVSGSDWENEEVRIVPITAKNIVDWLTSPGVSGLFTFCTTEASDQARRIQIATDTPGSDGSIQVQGGAANSTTSSVVGSAVAVGNEEMMVATFTAADLAGLRAGHWVSLDNAGALAKPERFQATTELTSLDADGVFTFTGGSPDFYQIIATLTDQTIQIERHGEFVAIKGAGDALVDEGAWLYITTPSTGGSPLSAANQGIFRVVRSTAAGCWIENDGAVEESQVRCDMKFLTTNSLMPGDIISISTDLWGVENQGNWVVEHVGTGSTLFNNVAVFRVSTDERTPVPVSSPGALGAVEALKVLALQGTPTRLIKRVHAIAPNQDDPELLDVKFDTHGLSTHVTESVGTVLTALDKLDFPTDLGLGADAYRYSVGLIGEASRIVYGDAADRSTYPGVIAEGAIIDVAGPLVRRIQISLLVRAISGFSKVEIAAAVRSAVASVVNRSGVGQPVPFSDIVAAATEVAGVLAVTVVTPTYAVGSDLVEAQPNEKLLVLDVEADVGVSFTDE